MKTLFAALVLTFTGMLSAQPETILTGKLLGHDGQPMVQTDIHLYRGAGQRAATTVHASDDGSYTLTLHDSGLVTVKFAGLFHLSEDIPLLIEESGTIHLDVRLGTYRINKDPKEIRIMGDFNNWNMQDATLMKKEADGTFTATFDAKEAKFGYQVIGSEIGGRSTNGTQSETYVYDGDGDYRSFVTPKEGKVRIVFDPAKVLTAPGQPAISFEDPDSRCAKYATIKMRMNSRSRESSEAMQAFVAGGGDPRDFKFEKDRSAELSAIAGDLKAEQDPTIHQALLMEYMSAIGKQGDPAIVKMFLAEMPRMAKDLPRARLFELLSPFMAAGRALGCGKDFETAYLDAMDNFTDASVKGNAALNVMSMVQSMNNDSLSQRYYDLTLAKLAGSPYQSLIKDRFSPRKAVVVGKPVPAFVTRALEDSAVTFSRESLKGKVYLLHFWATWNGPSVKEMENIHRVYEKFRPKNFEILSLSLDAKPEHVKKFREGKWKMPWLHALVTTDRKILSDFGSLASTLKPVLVDSTGTVIALQDELVGDRLEKTLNRVFKVAE